MGTHMQLVALPYFVYEQTGSSFATASTAAAQALPGVILGPLAGAIVDSRDGQRLLLASNLVLAAVTVAFCLTLLAPWWVALPVAFLQAVLAQLVAPAEIVLVPSLVPLTALPAANSLTGGNRNLARLLGPTSGGLLYAMAGLPAVAVVNAVSFAVAAGLVSRIPPSTGRPPHRRSPPARLANGRLRLWLTGGWSVGWTEIRRRPLLGRLLVVFVLIGTGEGCVSALLAPFTSEVFGSSTALGLLLTCQAAGGVAGALAMSRWTGTDHLPRTLGLACLGCAVLLAALVTYPLLHPRLWPALLLVAAAGVPFAAVAAAQTTLLQTVPHPLTRGRVYGVTTAAAGAAHVVGILTAGYLADRTSVYVLLLDAPCYLVAGLVLLRSPRRRNRRPSGLLRAGTSTPRRPAGRTS